MSGELIRHYRYDSQRRPKEDCGLAPSAWRISGGLPVPRKVRCCLIFAFMQQHVGMQELAVG